MRTGATACPGAQAGTDGLRAAISAACIGFRGAVSCDDSSPEPHEPMEAMPDMSMDADSQWLHDLRNAMNALGSGVALSRRLLEKGRPDDALSVLAQTEASLKECFALLAAADGFDAGASTRLRAPRVAAAEPTRATP